MKHFKALAYAYWNNSVSEGLVSQRQLDQCEKKGLLIKRDIPYYNDKDKEFINKYPELKPSDFDTRVITRYYITDKGLDLFSQTESYKTSNANLNR